MGRINTSTAGEFRLLDAEPFIVHICRDAGSKEEYNVLCVRVRGGKDLAIIASLPSTGGGAKAKPEYEPEYSQKTTWQEHLDAVRDGKREVVNVRDGTLCIYELTLEDGSKLIWSYGGPLMTESKRK